MGTWIALGDGTTKLIEELVAGDIVAGINYGGQPAEQTVNRVTRHESECLEISFEEAVVTCTASHVFIGKGVNELFASHLTVGDEVLGSDGSLKAVTSIKPIGSRTVFDIEVSPDHMFVAGGLIHHNKFSCTQKLYPYD